MFSISNSGLGECQIRHWLVGSSLSVMRLAEDILDLLDLCFGESKSHVGVVVAKRNHAEIFDVLKLIHHHLVVFEEG